MTTLGALMGFLLFPGISLALAEPANVVTAPAVPAYEVAMTAYNAVPEQTDSTPFETASGAYSNPEVVAARSQDLGEELPFGTIIEINSPLNKQEWCGYDVVSSKIGYRVIADTMNVRIKKRIDVLFDSDANYTHPDGSIENASSILGICHSVTVRVVGRIDPKRMGNLPKTQRELAAIVNGSLETALALK